MKYVCTFRGILQNSMGTHALIIVRFPYMEGVRNSGGHNSV